MPEYFCVIEGYLHKGEDKTYIAGVVVTTAPYSMNELEAAFDRFTNKPDNPGVLSHNDSKSLRERADYLDALDAWRERVGEYAPSGYWHEGAYVEAFVKWLVEKQGFRELSFSRTLVDY